MKCRLRPRSLRAFTLLELCIVIAVLSLMIGGMMAVFTEDMRTAKQAELKLKMDAIETALVSFAKVNSRLPCPADLTLLITNSYYGVEGVSSGACTTGSTYSATARTAAASPGPTANFLASGSTNVVAGAVPVRALGLPDAYGFDPWGGRFTYVIDKSFTGAAALTTSTPTGAAGAITVKNAAGNTRTSTAVAVLISHGPNGHGAYQLNGAGTRKSSGSTNTNEQQNCHCNSSATATAYDNSFVQQPPSDSNAGDVLKIFDDTVRYYLRTNFMTATDKLTESH